MLDELKAAVLISKLVAVTSYRRFDPFLGFQVLVQFSFMYHSSTNCGL